MKKCYRKRSEGGPIENRALLMARAWFLRSQGLLEVFQKARKMTRGSPRVSRGRVKVTPWIPINAARVPTSAPKDLNSTPRSPQGSPKVPPRTPGTTLFWFLFIENMQRPYPFWHYIWSPLHFAATFCTSSRSLGSRCVHLGTLLGFPPRGRRTWR